MSKTVSKVMDKMIKYFDGDIRRINHALKVYGFSKTIGELEELSDENIFILETAAILHDIGIKVSEEKYKSSAGHYQEFEGPAVARELLEELKLSEDLINRIAYLIGNHHTYSKIDGIDFQILVEADFLVNIFEDEISLHRVTGIRDKYFKTESGIEILDSMYKL